MARVPGVKHTFSFIVAAAVAAGFGSGCDQQDSHDGHDHGNKPQKVDNATKPSGGGATTPSGNATTPAGNATKTSGAAYPIKVCVVSGEDLGSMGKPEEVTHKGVLVKLCCEGCKEDFDKDPAKYVALLQAGGPKPKAKPEVKPKG